MNHDHPTAEPKPPPPPQERTRPVPPQIADLLALLHLLLAYGRHLALTLDRRAAAGRFAVIAQCFGTARLAVIRARLTRGLLRIQALQRVLLARARRGRDLAWLRPLPPRQRPPRPAKPQGNAAPDRPAPRRRADPDAAPDPDNLPTIAQLEAEIRRHPIGRTVADICRDLGVAPGLCTGWLWNAVFDRILWHRGNLSRLVLDFRRREIAFIPEWDRNPALGLPEHTSEAVRDVLGFLIGECWPRLPHQLPAPFRLPATAASRPP